MNTYDAYNVGISFQTDATNCEDAWNELVNLLNSLGVEIIFGNEEELTDENGNEIQED